MANKHKLEKLTAVSNLLKSRYNVHELSIDFYRKHMINWLSIECGQPVSALADDMYEYFFRR